MLPNSIPNSFFIDLDKIFTQFIWRGKNVKIDKPQKIKEGGGVGISNM